MIEMILLLIIFGWILLFGAFFFKDYPLSAFSSMFLIILGIYIAFNDLPNVTDRFLTSSLSAIHMGVGGFVFIKGGMEQFTDLF